jgi:hypothetical protein
MGSLGMHLANTEQTLSPFNFSWSGKSSVVEQGAD